MQIEANDALEKAKKDFAAAKDRYEYASMKRTDDEWTAVCHAEVVAEAVAEEKERVITILRTLARVRGERRPWDGVDGCQFIEWSTQNPAHRMEKKTARQLICELVCEAEEADAEGTVGAAASKMEIRKDIAREKLGRRWNVRQFVSLFGFPLVLRYFSFQPPCTNKNITCMLMCCAAFFFGDLLCLDA